jgi:hypothetical protein
MYSQGKGVEKKRQPGQKIVSGGPPNWVRARLSMVWVGPTKGQGVEKDLDQAVKYLK